MSRAACAAVLLACVPGGRAELRNVLFLIVDDMGRGLGCYNESLAHTPNLDKLAAGGLTFDRAYVQYSFCAPSRTSFMSGRRPDTTKAWNFQDNFRQVPGGVSADWASLPQYFKRHNYTTLGCGKLFHPNVPPNNDAPYSWTEGYPYVCPECKGWRPEPPEGAEIRTGESPLLHNLTYFRCTTRIPETDAGCGPDQPGKAEKTSPFCPTYCATNTSADETRGPYVDADGNSHPGYQLEDQVIADACIDNLRAAKKRLGTNNFFVGCGFHKPHAPWIFPESFAQYTPAVEDIPLAADLYAPVGMPDIAWHLAPSTGFDVAGLGSVGFNGTTNVTLSKYYRKGYYASVAYQDYNIGRVLDALAALGLEGSTAVSLMSDHGYQLGEHDLWAKMTNFELGTKTPLIFRAPWIAGSVGQRTKALAEAVDLYPTLAALAGLPAPRSEGEMVNGTDLSPVFHDPAASVKDAAFSQFAKVTPKKPFAIGQPARNKTGVMGYTVRVEDWRYTAWFNFDKVNIHPDLGRQLIGRELYDHRGDTGLWIDFPGENENLVDRPEYAGVVQGLHQRIVALVRAGFNY